MLTDCPINYNEEQKAERPFMTDIMSYNKSMESAGLEPYRKRISLQELFF
jgi:hypothetical protein